MALALLVAAAWALCGVGDAVALPDTVLIGGPTGPTDLEDVVFWWAGQSDDAATPLAGYRYSLDGADPVFTTRPTATFYGLAPGEHTFTVAAVGLDFAEDDTPAGAAFAVSGLFRVEVEPNGFDIVPTPLVSGLPVRATSSDANDADWYVLTPGPNARQVALTFRRPGGGRGATAIKVYRDQPAFGDLILDGAATVTTNQTLSATFGGDAVPYFVHVQTDATEQVGSLYTLTMTATSTAAVWDAEPNDTDVSATVIQASDLTESARVFGSSDAIGDEDWYRVVADVSSPRLLRLTAARPGSRGSAVIEAFAGSLPDVERQIALLDIGVANDQFATFETAVGVGDILIRVAQDDDIRDVPYALTLAMSDIPAGDAYEIEPNGVDPRVNPRSANALGENARVVGGSWAADADVDWFRLDLTRPGVLGVDLDRPTGRGSTTARLYNPNFLLVGEAVATAANGQTATLTSIATAGAYYVELTPQGESPHAPYTLSTNLESPGVFSAEHSATGALTLGDVLTVNLLAPPGLNASFSLGNARVNLPMFDDGAHDDGAANDGAYAGSYAVRATDELLDLNVTARVTGIDGVSSERVVGPPVTLDGRAPDPVGAVAASDAPDDDGGILLVEWTAGDEDDLDHYYVYIETAPITSVAGLTPALRTSGVAASVSVASNGAALFIAVTAVDRAGNESALAPGSVAGPVTAEDNRLPTPITAVVAQNVPDDLGGALRVRWTPAFLPDFAEYRVYAASEAIDDVALLAPVARVRNAFRTDVDITGLPSDAPVFVAVTVLDRTGSESTLGEDSVAGPAVATAEATLDTSPLGLVGPTGVLRGASATFHWMRFAPGRAEPVGDALVTLDGVEERLVSGASTTFHDLPPGRHTIRVVETASGVAATAVFHVDPFAPPDGEPNDVSSQAETLLPNEAVAGSVANDGDWTRIQAPAPGIASITVTWRTGAIEPRVYRQATVGALVDAATLDVSSTRATFSVGTLGEPLLVEVRGDGAYELSYTWAPTPAFVSEREPNDTRGQAAPAALAPDVLRLRGMLATGSDVDWFALPTSTPGNVVIRAYAPGAAATRLRVYRDDRQVGELPFGDDGPAGVTTLRMDSAPYFIAVDGATAGAEYQVAVASDGLSQAREMEPNDGTADATLLPLDALVTGDTWRDGDRDTYRVDVPSSGTLVASLSRAGASVATTVRALGGSGVELGAATTEAVAGITDEAHAQASIGPGVYYVAVDSDEAEDTDYELHVTVFADLRHDVAGTLKAGDGVTASLTWRPGATVTAELVDPSGVGARGVAQFLDEDASGAYAATWQVRDGEDGDGLTLRARVTADGRTRLVTFPGEIAIDTTAPSILSASHDARAPLGVGAVLRVTATAEPGAFGAFSLLRADGAAARADVPMEEIEDGKYAAELVVRAADHLVGGVVRVSFEDEVANQATRDISRKLTLDTLPPRVESVTHDAEGALVEGDAVAVTTRGDPGARGSFAILVDGDTPFREDIPTFDDGAHDDGAPDDGVYRGEYTVRPGDIALGAIVRARLVDDAGNAAYAVAAATVTIDASTPTITTASHDADAPLALGATLRVTVVGSSGAEGSFEIRRGDGTVYRSDLRLVETDVEGEYAGAFDVGVGADLADGVVTVTLRKANGKTATRTLAVPVTFDTTPPPAVLGVVARDVEGDEGGFIALAWDAASVGDFERYEVYRSPTPLASVEGRTPEPLDLSAQQAEFVVVAAPTGVAQYFAVVAIDRAGNASGLSLEVGGSVSARAEAADNLPPLPIRNVAAIDRPNDGGGALSVVWEPTPALDFAEYRLYVSDLPFLLGATPRARADTPSAPVVRLRTPSVTVADVPTPVDGVEMFVTVSAVDAFGNESVVGPGGMSGPVVSQADGAPTPGGGFSVFGGPTGVARHSSVAFRWSRFAPDANPIDDYRFSIDGGPARFTGETEALLTGLTPGEHVFSVAPADGSAPTVTRRFAVDPVAIPEREPNDAPDIAMSLPPGVAVDGVLTDDGDIDRYRVQLSAPAQVGLHLARAGAGVAHATLTSPSFAAGSEDLATISADGLARPNAHATMILAAGEYLLHVTGQTGAYRAVVAAHPAPSRVAWDLEPNDDPRRATPLFADTAEISGAANRDGDVDWYRLSIPTDAFPIIELDIAQAASREASRFEIFHDAPGEDRAIISSVTLTPDEPTVRLRAGMRQGDILLKATASAGSVYAARVGFAPLPPDVALETEPNGVVETANSVPPGARVDASLWGDDDTDWYRVDFAPDPGGLVALTLDAAERGAVVEAEAFTVGLESLGAFVPSPSAPNAYALTVPAAARAFFVRVRGSATDYAFAALALSTAEHDADGPLGAGAELTATVRGDEGWQVRAEIASHGVEFPLISTTPGVYVGAYAVEPGANIREAPLVVVIDAPRGVSVRVPLTPPVTLDTVPPAITNARHSAGRPLRADEELTVSAVSEAGSRLSYEIAGGAFRVLGDMFDDGAHDDGDADDGNYVGVYRVRPGDAAVAARVSISAEDAVGNERTVAVSRAVALDTTPPLVEQVSHSGESALRAGDRLVVTARAEEGARATFSVEGVRDGLPLVDDGTRGDESPGDGVYVGSTLILEGDNTAGAIVSVQFTDMAGNVATAHAALPVSIDTEAPPIDAVTHDATAPLREGDRLLVSVTGEPGGTATFDIGAERRDIAMFDDGDGDDDTANDGVYTGAYVVRRDDDLPEALITARVTDRNGNVGFRAAVARVTLDAVPPPPVGGLTVEDVPGDQGSSLRLAWTPIEGARDFLRYHVYRATSPIRSTRGLTPVSTEIVDVARNSIELDVPGSNVDYYFALTAVDIARNESLLAEDGSSTFGPARATDDLPPAGVLGVAADDAPEDDGGFLVVSWASRSDETDFGGYAVFVDSDPAALQSLTGLEAKVVETDRTVTQVLVPTPADGEAVYVVVAARDINGNHSAVTDESRAGPVVSTDDTAPQPVSGVLASDAPGDEGGRLRVTWDVSADPTVVEFEVFLSPAPIRSSDDALGLDVAVTAARPDDLEQTSAGANVPTSGDEEWHVAVIAVDGGGNRSDIGVGSTDGPVRAVANVLTSSSGALIQAGFDPSTSVRIPDSVARPGVRVDIYRVLDAALGRSADEANLNLATANIDDETEPDLRVSLRFFDGSPTTFAEPLTLTVSFPPPDSSEVARDLRLFRLNTDAVPARWDVLPGEQTVDLGQGVVSAESRTLGVFRVARLLLPGQLGRVTVAPNPFRPDRDGAVTIRNLTEDASVEIFTLDARRVTRLGDTSSGMARWDGRNSSGVLVASGLYLYLIQSPNDRRVGQILVIR